MRATQLIAVDCPQHPLVSPRVESGMPRGRAAGPEGEQKPAVRPPPCVAQCVGAGGVPQCVSSGLTITSWEHAEEEGREGHVKTRKRSTSFRRGTGCGRERCSFEVSVRAPVSSGLGRAWGGGRAGRCPPPHEME